MTFACRFYPFTKTSDGAEYDDINQIFVNYNAHA